MRLATKASVLALLALLVPPQDGYSQDQESGELLLRFDDLGMSHSVNSAISQIVDLGIPMSTSVMFACPWYLEAVEILRGQEHVSVGVHLTLNSEWRDYKWGPVLGKAAVPSLVDEQGHFFPSRSTFHANGPMLSHVEAELRAQIERALATGLDIDYVDYHMGAAVDKLEHREIVETLANEYGLGISRYFGESDTRILYSDPIESKTDSLTLVFDGMREDRVNLFVIHVGLDTPELRAMKDQNPFGPEEMSRHRSAELQAILSPRFTALLREREVELITYKQLIGRAQSRRPVLN